MSVIYNKVLSPDNERLTKLNAVLKHQQSDGISFHSILKRRLLRILIFGEVISLCLFIGHFAEFKLVFITF